MDIDINPISVKTDPSTGEVTICILRIPLTFKLTDDEANDLVLQLVVS